MREFNFADDVLIAAWGEVNDTKERIEEFLEDIQSYYKANGLSCNVEKSQCLVITGTLNRLPATVRRESKEVQIEMAGRLIPRKDEMYLGVTMTEKWSSVKHISNSLAKVAAITGAMQTVLKKKKLLSAESKMAFYKAAVRPVIGYGFPLWSGTSSHQIERMRKAERRFVRWRREDMIHGSFKFVNSKFIYREAGIKRLDAWLVDLYLKELSRFRKSPNSLMQALFTPENEIRCRQNEKYKQPEALYHENTRNPLFDAQGRIYHFNRRINDGGSVYVTEQ